MGAKTSVKLRARGTAFKCNLCGRKLMSMEALISHERTAHNIITRRNKTKQATKPINANKKEVKQEANKEVKLVKKQASPPKITQKIPEPISTPVESEDKTLTQKGNVEFKCPKCFSVFASYFPAHKHIQKFHCVNKQGVKVAPNSSNLIQPIRIEQCIKCNKKVTSVTTHKCDIDNIVPKTENHVLICTACDNWLPNMKAFDTHVLSAHGDNIESMFFPTITEFTKWKSEMEAQTGVSYMILEKYDTKLTNKRYYHCNFITENDEKDETTFICPSTIVVQEFPKGIQVHFSSRHYKHKFSDYTLMEKYKKFSITSFLKRSEEYNNLPTIPSDDSDLYLQFKNLMEGIIVDAAKLNIATLKVLHGKALDMTSLLTNYDEEVEENDVLFNVNHTSDAQLTKTVKFQLPINKRKNNVNTDDLTPVKRVKEDLENDMSPKIVNSFSLADNNKAQKNNKSDTDSKKSDDDIEKSKQNDKKSNERDPYSSSFNDSYKDFVVKNFPVPEGDNIKRASRRRPVFLTKIGQFKPNMKPNILQNILPKPPKTQEETKVKEKPQEVTKVKEKPQEETKVKEKPQEETKVKEKPQEQKKVKEKPQEQKKVKEKPQEEKKVKEKTHEETKVKTKFGTILEKPVDIKYEVKEQEEGCNILILKL